MSRGGRLTVAAVVTATAVLVWVTSMFLSRQGSADRAAAWATILSLPVAIIGLAVTVVLAVLQQRQYRPEPDPSSRQEPRRDARPTAAPPAQVRQVGRAGRDQVNVAGSATFHVSNGGRPQRSDR